MNSLLDRWNEGVTPWSAYSDTPTCVISYIGNEVWISVKSAERYRLLIKIVNGNESSLAVEGVSDRSGVVKLDKVRMWWNTDESTNEMSISGEHSEMSTWLTVSYLYSVGEYLWWFRKLHAQFIGCGEDTRQELAPKSREKKIKQRERGKLPSWREYTQRSDFKGNL